MSDPAQRDTPCDGLPLLLAESEVGRITACACGNVHIDVEYLTLRFTPTAFATLVATLAQAQRRLDHEAPKAVSAFGERAVH